MLRFIIDFFDHRSNPLIVSYFRLVAFIVSIDPNKLIPAYITFALASEACHDIVRKALHIELLLVNIDVINPVKPQGVQKL